MNKIIYAGKRINGVWTFYAAEIATVEHANGLKLDNIARLLMKINDNIETLCEAWKK